MGTRRERLGERLLAVVNAANWLGILMGLVLVAAIVATTVLTLVHR